MAEGGFAGQYAPLRQGLTPPTATPWASLPEDAKAMRCMGETSMKWLRECTADVHERIRRQWLGTSFSTLPPAPSPSPAQDDVRAAVSGTCDVMYGHKPMACPAGVSPIDGGHADQSHIRWAHSVRQPVTSPSKSFHVPRGLAMGSDRGSHRACHRARGGLPWPDHDEHRART